MRITVGDGVQWHIGGPNRKIESGKLNSLPFAERVVRDSMGDTSSEGTEVAHQHDSDQESGHLA
jgi:hypothetical protein